MKFTGVFLLFVVIIFSACTIPKLKYFQLDPYAKPFPIQVKAPLSIVFMNHVEDKFIVKTEGVKEMQVSNFRRSFGESLQNTLNENFDSIQILDHRPDTGLSLVVYRIRPYWRINSRSSSTYESNGETRSSSTNLISAAFQFESSLFLDGEHLSSADMTVYSDDQMIHSSHAHAVFKSGLIKTCETIHKEIFTKDVIHRIYNDKK